MGPCGNLTGAGTGAVLDLGHVATILSLQEAGGRLVSLDSNGTWALWDLAAHSWITGGEGAGALQLGGV